MLTGGVAVHLNAALDDGKVLLAADGSGRTALHIGTRPLTEVERARLEGRYLVRRGMADVLAWLGESVGPPPPRPGAGRRLWDLIQASTEPATDSPVLRTLLRKADA